VEEGKAGGAVTSVIPILGLARLFPGSPPPASPRPCGASPPLRGLTHHLKLVTRQHFLRFSILKETPTVPNAYPLSAAGNVGHIQFTEGGAELRKRIDKVL
jgi:hypothetical protein